MTTSLHTQTSAPNTAAATSVSPLEQSGSSKTKFSKAKTDIYQTVTDNIIAALEASVKPWSCPWQRVPGMSGLPSNFATGIAYSGINIMLLWCRALEQGFGDSRWMTWSGGKKRLNREMKGKFGSADYAEEELVAELGSAFLMADLGIVGEVQHESYIASWLQALKNDKRYVFKAASAASKAHRYLMDKI
ncbi:zincin-like metallopeptidase domain-containing protein [Pectobacterium carotovorum]|uniref:zincin-like metallopeptidase domain-containing protein n=1 Tax=Pectobacterium carotovorum TaxID=554 RepID=UPI0030162684